MSRFGTTLVLVAAFGFGCAAPARPASRTSDPRPTPAPALASTSLAAEPATAPVEPSPEEPEPESESESEPSDAYRTPLLEPRELAAVARQVCERSRSSGRPILVELSAPWCKDCLVLESIKDEAPLRDEIARWEWFPINVGDGFQHPDVMRAFQVDAIAKLVALRPPSCAVPLAFWRPIASRTLSGLSSENDALNSTLSAWLSERRADAD